jgi:hypothetical protein
MTYSIFAGSQNGAFVIDPSSGQISCPVASAPALQVPNVNFTVTLAVRDAGINGPVMWAYSNITITIVQSLNAPTVPSYALFVPELSPTGTFVANVSGDSLNFKRTLTYTLTPTTFYALFPFQVCNVLLNRLQQCTTIIVFCALRLSDRYCQYGR